MYSITSEKGDKEYGLQVGIATGTRRGGGAVTSAFLMLSLLMTLSSAFVRLLLEQRRC